MFSDLQTAESRLAAAEQRLQDAQQRCDGDAAEFAHSAVVSAKFTVDSMRRGE